jgi:pyruvate,orthophosphate dikinase
MLPVGPGRGPGAGGSALEGFLDQHAELRDVVAKIRGATDIVILHGLLLRLCTLLDAHFASEEAAGGVLEMLGKASGGETGPATQLIEEHRRLQSAVEGLLQRTGAEEDLTLASVAGELDSILLGLQEHEARENDLLARAMSVESAAPSADEARRSGALEVNLRRTAVDVVIPSEQRVLLEVVAGRYGVHENTKKLLREFNHPYVGWAQTLEDLHQRAMGDFAYYIAHERAAEAVQVYCDLYLRAAVRATPVELRGTSVRKLLYYVEKIVRDSGSRRPLLEPTLAHALSRLRAVLEADPDLAPTASARLRHLAEALVAEAPAAEVTERCLELCALSLREVYTQWIAEDDPARWWRECIGGEEGLPPELAEISHAGLRNRLKELDELAPTRGSGPLTARADALLALPDAAEIERRYVEAAPCVDSAGVEPGRPQLERIRWLIHVLSIEKLAPVHERVLTEISSAHAEALTAADGRTLDRIVHDTFAALRSSALLDSSSGQRLISRIGAAILESGDAARAQAVIDEMLECDFPRPAFAGYTEEWKVQVDPAHLRAIRTYLAVIGAAPELARPLIAALIVHLKLGGVFIADTDLFQRDVSALLNSGIRPVHHLIVQLLRVFPVYFSDIGAEGALREVSSRIDEIGGRRDPLCHFLRKQSHVESNPRLIDFIEAIASFWATGRRDPLQAYVPTSLYEQLDVENEEHRGVHRIFAKLAPSGDPASVLALDPSSLERRVMETGEGRTVDREKVRLLVELRGLVGRKYELDHADLLERLAAFHGVSDDQIAALREALAQGHHEIALDLLLGILEQLNEIVLSEERTEGVEDIYRKRHIAVGIPSLYGRYQEEKFEAVGLAFRVQSMASALFERLVAEGNLDYVTRAALRRVLGWLRLMLRALRIDGCQGRGVATGIAMLEQALGADGISVDQYVNIFQFLARSVENLIRIRFLDTYEGILDRILRRSPESPGGGGDDAREAVLKVSETFLRDQIGSSFGLQPIDHLIATVLRSLLRVREALERPTLDLLMTYDADRSVVAIEAQEGPQDGIVYLGNKGYMIKRLAHEGLPVPPGFILTTEVFRCRDAILACDELHRELIATLEKEVARLGRLCGSRFGDPSRPLLLSVRSGSAISMPGVLDTFLNVGMNEEVVEGFAVHSGSGWGAWDAYRRFLQLWGMGHGIERDVFDALMRDAKREFGVAKKAHLPTGAMKRVALRYRGLLLDHSVDVSDDPVEQLRSCVDLVLRSWDSERARVYRRASQIAEEWGTAVIVQNMVYGNLHERSGTGVVLTRDPHHASGDVRLYGDFIVQGQGEDVVSGLVETFPISEEQRAASRGRDVSLEKDFPRIHHALMEHARTLIHELGMFHQEIEFTFESDDPADLYILQTRDTVMTPISSAPAFDPGEDLERARIATGIGAGRGALSGRVAHTAADIAQLRERFPDDSIILLRPDTVPDDLPMILEADGLLTALGGATSHAAVAAQRLGRTCVVGCRELDVDEGHSRSTLAGVRVDTGDFVSIDGRDGSVYLGRHPSTIIRRQLLA